MRHSVVNMQHVEAVFPWKQMLLALAIGLVVTVLAVVVVFRAELFGGSSRRQARPAVEKTSD